MPPLNYDRALTALLVVDPYNDFISEGGKLWPRVREVAKGVQCVTHMYQVLEAARSAEIQVVFAPHRRWRKGDYTSWKYWAPTQKNADHLRVFEDGTWGGTFREEFMPLPEDIVAQEHWCSSGFANTDLDLQLKKHGLHQLIVIGLRANTCIEATVRYAVELGYEVTLVKDATASFSWDEMKGVLETNLPSYAHAILPADELIPKLSR